jgi:hypothetical protein
MLLPILVACFTPGPLLLGYGIHLISKTIRNRRLRDSKVVEGGGLINKANGAISPESHLLQELSSEKVVEAETIAQQPV